MNIEAQTNIDLNQYIMIRGNAMPPRVGNPKPNEVIEEKSKTKRMEKKKVKKDEYTSRANS